MPESPPAAPSSRPNDADRADAAARDELREALARCRVALAGADGLVISDESRQDVAARLDRIEAVLADADAAGSVLASRLIRALDPDPLPAIPDLELAAYAAPSDAVGGNAALVVPAGPGHAVIVVFDASGQGLPVAALCARAAVEVMHCIVSGVHRPTAILGALNERLLGRPGDRYLRAFAADLDVDLMNLAYVNASHCEPLWLRAARTESIDTQGLFVGLFEDAEYEEKCLRLADGEVLLFYSDAVVDALRHRAGVVEPAGLLRFADEHRGDSARALVASLAADVVEHPTQRHHDDPLLLAVRCVRAEPWRSVIIPSVIAEGERICDAILEHCTLAGLSEKTIFASKLALEEAMTNAIRHGNKGDPARKVHVQYSVSPRRVVVVITDEGDGFNPADVPDPTAEDRLDIPSGRGIMLMRHYMSSVEFNDQGNQIKLVRTNDDD